MTEPTDPPADERPGGHGNTGDLSHAEPADAWESDGAERPVVHPGQPGVSETGEVESVGHPGGTDPEHPSHP